MATSRYSRREQLLATGLVMTACGTVLALWFNSLYGLPETVHRLERDVSALQAQQKESALDQRARTEAAERRQGWSEQQKGLTQAVVEMGRIVADAVREVHGVRAKQEPKP